MMHDDRPRPKLHQVQSASPDDEPDHPLWVGGVERHQTLTGTFEDRLPCVVQRSGHGIVHRPGFSGASVQEPERPGIFLCEQEPRQEQRRGCGKGGLEKVSRVGNDMGFSVRFRASRLKAAPTASIVAA
jgi:hypothetical protein